MRDLGQEAVSIYLESMKKLDLGSAVQKKLRLESDQLVVGTARFDLERYREVLVIAFGKASEGLVAAIEGVLGDRLTRGILVTNRRLRTKTRCEVIVSGHPLPDENSFKAGRRVSEVVESCRADSLILFAISGGGSALVELPLHPGITLPDLIELNRSLVGSGATIAEINVVRKHLSAVKGGRLGYLARNAQVVVLLVSDVNAGDLTSIASNPLLPDKATLEDFVRILDRYDLKARLPESIRNLILEKRVPGLPQWAPGDRLLAEVLLDNKAALSAGENVAEARGFRVVIDRAHVEGDYKTVADALITRVLELRDAQPAPVCVLSGGEVLTNVTGRGYGGRNQEFVLYCAARLSARRCGGRFAVLSCGTDGIDGNSPATGAVAVISGASENTNDWIEASSYLAENSSTSFFSLRGGLVMTGPTGNNVRDLRIFLAH